MQRSIQNNNSSNIQGHVLVGYVLEVWEEIVSKVAKKYYKRNSIVCGWAVIL